MAEAKWYVVHTYSGYENKVRDSIESTILNRNLSEEICEVMIPMEKAEEIKNGVAKEVERKMFPGYVLVKMIMNDDTWYVIRNTRGVTGFVGPGSEPIPLTDAEVANLGIAKKTASVSFAVGDTVKIVSGTLNGMEGRVDEIDEANNTVSLTVSVFGRQTSATIEISAVQKLDI